MTCLIDSSRHISLCVSNLALRRRIVRCPVCECMTEMVLAIDRSPYYSPTLHCCKCGDAWGEDGLLGRPFVRGWREQAVRRHRAMWVEATYGLPPSKDCREDD